MNMKIIFKAFLLTIVFLLPFAALPAQSSLDNFNAAVIAEVREAERNLSHKDSMVNTINLFLDCAAAGKIEVALIGWEEVPRHIVDMWQGQNEDAVEVSISRYRLVLAAKLSHEKTDFYGFRAVSAQEKLVETLIMNHSQQHKASLIAKYVDGDAFGKFKSLARVLDELKSFIEEGQISARDCRFSEVTQRVHDLWRRNCGIELYDVDPAVKRFEVNCPSGIEYFWRVTGRADGVHVQILIYRNQLLYVSRNGVVEVK